MPKSVERSVRCWASAWRRWSGFAPMAPEFDSRKARFGLSHSSRRSFDQALAQHHFGGLIEPHLRDVEDEQYARQLGEDAELLRGRPAYPCGQRIVEWPVPGVEPDLHVGRRAHDRDERAGQHLGACCAGARAQKPDGHPHEIGEKTAQRRLVGACRRRLVVCWTAAAIEFDPSPPRPFSHDPAKSSWRTLRITKGSPLYRRRSLPSPFLV